MFKLLLNFLRTITFRKRPFKLTRAGWVFILYTIGVGAGAINTGNNLLYLIFGVFLGLIIASGILSDANLWHVSHAVDFPRFAEADEPSLLSVRLTNHKSFLPAISVTVHIVGILRGEEVEIRAFFPIIRPGQTVSREVVFTPPGRGFFSMNHVRLTTKHPFGLLRKRWTISRESKAAAGTLRKSNGIFIHPHLSPPPFELMAAFARSGDEPSVNNQAGEGLTVSTLREFNLNDNPRLIHWKATAKRGGLDPDAPSWLVRELEQENQKEMILVWPSLSELSSYKPAIIERLIQITASILDALKSHGVATQLILADNNKPQMIVASPDNSNEKDVIWEFLAVFDPCRDNAWGQAYLQPVSGLLDESMVRSGFYVAHLLNQREAPRAA